jgi:cell division protein FtsB
MAARARPAKSATATRRTATRKAASRPKSGSARRKPAARRKPGARRDGSRIRWDRVGRIALTFVLAAVLYSYLNPAIDFVKTYTATTAAKAEFHEELRENKRLHKRIQTADEPAVISRRARAQGMVAEGETPIVVTGLGG